MASGLEQAYATYGAICQANKSAILIAKRDCPEAKPSIGFYASMNKKADE